MADQNVPVNPETLARLAWVVEQQAKVPLIAPECYEVTKALVERQGQPLTPPIEPVVFGPAEISRLALDLRSLYVVQTLAAGLAINPTMPLLTAFRLAHLDAATKPVTATFLDPTNGMKRTFLAADALKDLFHMSYARVHDEFLDAAMSLGLVELGDRIATSRLADPAVPLLQFVRHARNGVAHGGRWSFGPGQPRHRAEFRGVTLSAAMHGQPVRDTVRGITYVELLEAVSERFGPPSPVDPTFPLWNLA